MINYKGITNSSLNEIGENFFVYILQNYDGNDQSGDCMVRETVSLMWLYANEASWHDILIWKLMILNPHIDTVHSVMIILEHRNCLPDFAFWHFAECRVFQKFNI